MDESKEKVGLAIRGCLLGTAVGDALGLPMEGLSRRRQAAMYPDLERYHLIMGRGLVSDDTEHAILVARALAASAGDGKVFVHTLARSLKWWLAALPAGVGLATGRAILKLWLGWSGERAGVWSAGNGPAMRAAIIGVVHAGDLGKMAALVRLSTRITHTDPRAEHGSQAVALAAAFSSRGEFRPEVYLAALSGLLGNQAGEFLDLMEKAGESASAGQAPRDFAAGLGLEKGVTGYVYHTVPVALQAWMRHPRDLPAALAEIIRCGGDTDTTAAITGGVVGAGVGPEGIPGRLLDKLWAWPRGLAWLETLAEALTGAVLEGRPRLPPRVFFPFVLVRNLFFLLVVLGHGFRRLLPPY